MAQVVERVIACVAEVFSNKGVDPPTLSASTPLDAELGLDSLDYAELVSRLEGEFGFDPFATDTPPAVRTVSDLAELYRAARARA